MHPHTAELLVPADPPTAEALLEEAGGFVVVRGVGVLAAGARSDASKLPKSKSLQSNWLKPQITEARDQSCQIVNPSQGAGGRKAVRGVIS